MKCKTNVYSLRAVSHRQICWVLINTGDGIREALQNVREKFGRIPYLPIIGHFDTADNLTRTTWHRGQFDTTCKNGQFNRCQIVQCQIVHGLKLSGVKLSWCQIVRCQIVCGVNVSAVSNCPGVKLSAKMTCVKFSGVKLSAVPNYPPTWPVSNYSVWLSAVSNCPVSNCPGV